MKQRLVLILGIVISLSGCSLAPKYTRPTALVPEHWPSGDAYLKTQPAADVLDATQLKWQDFFSNQKLQRIIQIALDNNQDLRLAALNVEKARALYGIQRSALLPAIDANGSLTKQRYSEDFLSSGSPNIVKQYSANLGITAWEIDFFGRIRSLKSQALEEYLGTEEARRSAQITLISEVACAYLVIAADEAKLNLARSTLTAQKKAYDLVLRQHRLEIVDEIDLFRAQTQKDAAQSDVAHYTQQVAQDKNALNLLVGVLIPGDLLALDLASVKPFRDIFPGLSSKVLLKRPDIIAAEHQLKGIYADIGAARAAFFPNISLTTAIGSASSAFSGLFSSASRGTWIYSPQIIMPIFDMRTWAAYRVSVATRKIVLTQYEKTIQTAFKEVADVLAVQGTIDQQIAMQQSMVDASEKIYRLSDKRYANGIDSYLSVLDAQRSLYSVQQGLISAQLSKLINQVSAYAVLGGGGWDGTDGQRRGNRDSFEEKVLSLLDF